MYSMGSSGSIRANRQLTPYVKRKPSFITAFRYGSCSSKGKGRVPMSSGLGIASRNSCLSLRRVSGWDRSQNITTSRTQAVVKVPAIMRTWASSERRTMDFSVAGSLESKIEWKIVGCERSLCFVFVPDVREEIWVSVFCYLSVWK